MVSYIDQFILGDRIMESPLKRYQTCKTCVACKKEMRPDEVCQIKQKEQVMDNLTCDENKGYSVSYPKNSLLKDQPKNEDSVQKIVNQLESKLIKNGLFAQFNDSLKQFIDAGVVAPISDFPEMEGIQKGYIPLCYSLANNDQATTKL